MSDSMPGCSDRKQEEALKELRSELREFSYDGLVQLRDDLAGDAVMRGSWTGCVISYRNGAPGSTRRDRHGRARNAFTVLWDAGWLTDEAVVACVDRELARRRVQPIEPDMPQHAVDRAAEVH